MTDDLTPTTTRPTHRFDEAVGTIGLLLVEVVGEDYLLDVEIGPDTSFADDIELESIDLVALTEQLELTYGSEVDFAGWIAGMDLDDIIALTVGDLAGFIVDATGGPDAADGADGAGSGHVVA